MMKRLLIAVPALLLGANAQADQVIPDDLIVQGSECVGFDCVNGENFGFDTIRLKENNLRIKFEDTSVSAGFPTNDWQLTANDSASGGLSKFSIDDITGARTPFTIEAGAPSHSLYVDDGGRVGIGTNTPVLEIHSTDGDTPGLRLQQDGSAGFQPQTWDIAGNETNFFVRDVTNGSSLPFRIRPGAPSSSIDIDAEGDVGFNTSSPEANSQVHIVSDGGNRSALRLSRDGNVGVVLEDTSSTAVEWSFGTSGSGDFNVALSGQGVVLQIDQSGNITCPTGSTINGQPCTGL